MAARIKQNSPDHHGSVLLLVLVVIAILTLGTATYLELMQNELQAVRHYGHRSQAARLAESGPEYVKSLLALTPEEVQMAGGLISNPAALQAVIVDDQADAYDRGRFTIVAPAQVDGIYSGVRYGLENESAKLNVNTLLAPGAEGEAINRLLALPGMTQEIAEAILDWLDPDDAARLNGAESDYYSSLEPGYAPRNGPIADLDELLLIRGVTPELLYGLDQNRNFFIDPNEHPRGVLLEVDNADGSMNRGWSAYLTVWSVENTAPPEDSTLIDLNNQDLQTLYNNLKSNIGDDKAKFVVLYRQYGPTQTNQPGGASGAQAAGGASSATRLTPGASSAGREPPGASNNGGNQQSPITASLASIQLNFQQQGGTQIYSPLDLVAVTVQLPGENNSPPRNVESPWLDNASAYRELLDLYDVAVVSRAQRIAGRININAASRVVLQSIPQLPLNAVGQIVSRREADPDRTLSEQRHAIWLLVEGIVTLDEMRQLERYVTVGGDVFSGQSVGFFDAGPAAARGEFVVERAGFTPKLLLWRDLSSLGRGFSTQLLGVEAIDAVESP